MKINLGKNRGFTIAEVLIGITVIVVTIVSITALVVSTISANSANLKRFVGSQLAQEGIEIVRNMRDSNWIRNLNWLGSEGVYANKGAKLISSPTVGQKEYFIVDHNKYYPAKINKNEFIPDVKKDDQAKDINETKMPWIFQNVLASRINDEITRLYTCKSTNGDLYYIHNGSDKDCPEKSLYKRYVSIEILPAGEYKNEPLIARVTSTVSWQEQNGEKKVELIEDFTDWRRGPL